MQDCQNWPNRCRSYELSRMSKTVAKELHGYISISKSEGKEYSVKEKKIAEIYPIFYAFLSFSINLYLSLIQIFFCRAARLGFAMDDHLRPDTSHCPTPVPADTQVLITFLSESSLISHSCNFRSRASPTDEPSNKRTDTPSRSNS